METRKDGNKRLKNKAKNEEQELEYYPDISNTSSACECTGLMPTPPENQEELESYQELSTMQIPKRRENEAGMFPENGGIV